MHRDYHKIEELQNNPLQTESTKKDLSEMQMEFKNKYQLSDFQYERMFGTLNNERLYHYAKL